MASENLFLMHQVPHFRRVRFLLGSEEFTHPPETNTSLGFWRGSALLRTQFVIAFLVIGLPVLIGLGSCRPSSTGPQQMRQIGSRGLEMTGVSGMAAALTERAKKTARHAEVLSERIKRLQAQNSKEVLGPPARTISACFRPRTAFTV